jgi:hypothetical protein
MKKHLLLILCATLALAGCGKTLTQADANNIVSAYLTSQKQPGEDAIPKGTLVADLNDDGLSEIVTVWTITGPTYWRNTLTVFAQTDSKYAPAASLPLTGEAKEPTIKPDGTILIDQITYAPNDPICCPTVGEHNQYRWTGAAITPVK